MATTLALLLLVSFISSFVLGQLGGRMSELEFRHLVQVENQLTRLQAAILAEAETPGVPIVLSSPVTLGSGGSPPFGSPSSGYLQKELPSFNLSTALTIEQVTPAPPRWQFGSPCFGNGNGTCSGNNGPVIVYNSSGNHTTFTPGVNGCGSTGCTILLNISGSFDQILVSLQGNNLGNVVVVVAGNWDNVTLSYSGSCNNHRQVTFLIYGTNNTYTASITGCAGSGAGLGISTLFIGWQQNLCPFANVSSTDKFLGISWGSSRNVTQNVTWWNDIGYSTAPHTLSQNGGFDFLTYANSTGTVPCAFTVTQLSTYFSTYLAGIRVHLNNRYIPPNDVVFDQGAVILGETDGGSIMLSPPSLSILKRSSGLEVRLTLITALGSLTTTTGIGTSAVTSRVISENTFHLASGQQGNLFIRSPFYLNITTAFPQAWATFFKGLPSAFPYGVTCLPPKGVPASQCLTPPPLTTVKLVVPMLVSTLTLTTVTVQVNVF